MYPSQSPCFWNTPLEQKIGVQISDISKTSINTFFEFMQKIPFRNDPDMKCGKGPPSNNNVSRHLVQPPTCWNFFSCTGPCRRLKFCGFRLLAEEQLSDPETVSTILYKHIRPIDRFPRVIYKPIWALCINWVIYHSALKLRITADYCSAAKCVFNRPFTERQALPTWRHHGYCYDWLWRAWGRPREGRAWRLKEELR